MPEPTLATILVPLSLPISLLVELENEATRQQISIPEKLSLDLIDAYEQRRHEEAEAAALLNLDITGFAPLTSNGLAEPERQPQPNHADASSSAPSR